MSSRQWVLPPEPDESVRAVRTSLGTIFLRSGHGEWTSAARTDGGRGGWRVSWPDLLQFAPLTDATHELKGTAS